MNDAGREALWSVAAARLPVYLFVFGVVIVVAMVMAVLTATGRAPKPCMWQHRGLRRPALLRLRFSYRWRDS